MYIIIYYTCVEGIRNEFEDEEVRLHYILSLYYVLNVYILIIRIIITINLQLIFYDFATNPSL